MRNIDKYLNNLTINDGIKCYRNDEVFKAQSQKICYISEYFIEEIQRISKVNPEWDLCDKDLLDHFGWNYNKLKKEVDDYFSKWGKKELHEYLIDNNIRYCDIVNILYNNLNWQSPWTELEQLTTY